MRPACLCPISGVIDLIGKKWTLCIVTSLGSNQGGRFKALLECLPGISPRTLSETLKALESEGIVSRHAYPEIPPRVEYQLTDEGRRLHNSIQPLMQWADKHPRPLRGEE